MVDVPIRDEKHHERGRSPHHPRQGVHFPSDPEEVIRPPAVPYPYIRQDSDAFSSRASSIGATDDEDDSSDYDWSGEEDLVDEEAKFGKKMGVKTKRSGFGPKRILSLMFSSLIGSTLFAGVIITPAILIHFYWYKPHPTEHRKYVRDNVQAWLFWAAANLVISWYLAMIIDIIPILSRYIISAVWGHVSEYVKTRIETYDSVKDTAKPAFYAGSAWASWAIIFGAIYGLYDIPEPSLSRAGYTIRTAQVVEFFFFMILIWCIQGMLSHFIAFSFHRTAYKERIDAVEKALVVIEKLRQYRPKTPRGTGTPRKSGTRTPVFGNMGFALSDKQHSEMLSGALRKVANSTPLHRSHLAERDDSEDADNEDGDKTLIESSKRHSKQPRGWNRLSFFGSEENELSVSRPISRQTSGSPESPENDRERTVERGGQEADIEMSPLNPSSGQVYSGMPPSSNHTNPFRYPPQGSPRGSVDGGAETTLRNAAKVIKSAVLHDARNMKGKEDTTDGLTWNVNSSHEAKRLARSIFMRFKDRRRSWLIPADFYPAFPDQESALEAFKVFDADNNGDLSRAEIKTVLLKVYKERRFLSRSMRDVGEALRTLDRILLFFAGVILFFISLSVFGVEVGDSLTSLYTLGIALSFIFKNACSSAFDAIMLLFVTHPYDTGDRVFIGDENLVVKKVGLFATVFTRSDGTETYLFNSQLFSQFILNVRRSDKTFENLSMQVAWRTPLSKLDALEKCLNDWLSTEEHRWFEPSTNITLQHIKFQRYLELTIGIGHNGNWQDWGTRNARKTAFHAAVQYYCRELGIVGYEAPKPIVYANPTTMRYDPAPSAPDDVLSPTSPSMPTASMDQMKRETEDAAKKMKPSLGFLPPLADRSSQLLRARKSRDRKTNLGAGNADA
ncbi:hypothetical protein CPC08DRAFT_623518 [Agrocybe pediades]|nr:hypothetical protein CPC08DRAFT_623518 [Agrocybe pediades]